MTRASTNRHTAVNLAEEMRGVFQEFHIEEKIECIVSDNAKNVVNAAKDITHHHACFTHTLNLAVKYAIKEENDTNSIVSKVKKIVGHFKSSTVSMNRLKAAQKSMCRNFLS